MAVDFYPLHVDDYNEKYVFGFRSNQNMLITST
jgi:hypothetical protein